MTGGRGAVPLAGRWRTRITHNFSRASVVLDPKPIDD
jgi:hypothetical protein